MLGGFFSGLEARCLNFSAEATSLRVHSKQEVCPGHVTLDAGQPLLSLWAPQLGRRIAGDQTEARVSRRVSVTDHPFPEAVLVPGLGFLSAEALLWTTVLVQPSLLFLDLSVPSSLTCSFSRCRQALVPLPVKA